MVRDSYSKTARLRRQTRQFFRGKPSRPGLVSASFLLLLSLLVTPPCALPAERPEVELYISNGCPYCQKAIGFFKERGIEVSIFNIDLDTQAAARKLQLDPRRGVPLAVIKGQVVFGYSPRAYTTALDE
jgi:glutaredoxin